MDALTTLNNACPALNNAQVGALLNTIINAHNEVVTNYAKLLADQTAQTAQINALVADVATLKTQLNGHLGAAAMHYTGTAGTTDATHTVGALTAANVAAATAAALAQTQPTALA